VRVSPSKNAVTSALQAQHRHTITLYALPAAEVYSKREARLAGAGSLAAWLKRAGIVPARNTNHSSKCPMSKHAPHLIRVGLVWAGPLKDAGPTFTCCTCSGLPLQPRRITRVQKRTSGGPRLFPWRAGRAKSGAHGAARNVLRRCKKTRSDLRKLMFDVFCSNLVQNCQQGAARLESMITSLGSPTSPPHGLHPAFSRHLSPPGPHRGACARTSTRRTLKAFPS